MNIVKVKVEVRALATHQRGRQDSHSQTLRQMWVEFVVGSRPCSKRFFSGYSGFPLSSKTSISNTVIEWKNSHLVDPMLITIYLFYLNLFL